MTSSSLLITDEMPITLDLPVLVAGMDYRFSLQILDDNGDPYDTTGYDMTIKGRAMDENGDVLFTLSVGSGITHTPAQGKFDIKISNTVSAAINVPYVAWDCKIEDASGEFTFPFKGTLKIQQPVTR